jgi:hypothetical protein
MGGGKMRMNLFYTFLILLLIVSCSKVEQDFKKAEEEHSILSYKSYIQKYPDSKYANQALQNYLQLSWRTLKEYDDYDLYIQFLNNSKEFINIGNVKPYQEKVIHRLQDIYIPQIQNWLRSFRNTRNDLASHRITTKMMLATSGNFDAYAEASKPSTYEIALSNKITNLEMALSLVSTPNANNIIDGINIYRGVLQDNRDDIIEIRRSLVR